MVFRTRISFTNLGLVLQIYFNMSDDEADGMPVDTSNVTPVFYEV